MPHVTLYIWLRHWGEANTDIPASYPALSLPLMMHLSSKVAPMAATPVLSDQAIITESQVP